MADQVKAATTHVEDFENNPKELDDISTREPGIVDVSVLKPERENRSIIDNTRTTEDQVSRDPNDPRNWSDSKKNLILLTIGVSAFFADFQGAAAVPCVRVQAEEWAITPNEANYANNLNVLMTGVFSLFWIPCMNTFGRAPVLFWATLSGTFFTLACAITTNFEVYYAMRAMMGLTTTAGQTVGLAFIYDIFFFHQRARKIGIWTACFLLAPFCGPLFANFVVGKTNTWRAAFWMMFGLGCVTVLLVTLFIDESWYRRDILPENQPKQNSRLTKLLGVWQVRQRGDYFPSFLSSIRRLIYILGRPIMVPIMISYLLSFMWSVGINQTTSIIFEAPVSENGYGFDKISVGFLCFTPVVAVCIGQLFGHFFNDFIANRYIRIHEGRFQSEVRLVTSYIAFALMVPGIVLVGQALRHHLPYVAVVMGWGMYVCGCMISSVSVTAYAVDAYPSASGEVAGFINFARLIGGFSVGYFQEPWGQKIGYDASFGTQAALIGVGQLIIVLLHIFGSKLRK